MTGSFQSSTAAVSRPPPDPTKHVEYQLGMVLGVDDFLQEFAYLANRDEWAVRDLIGYGTVWGLRVYTAPGPEVRVASGVGVTPRGRLVRVAPEQCASLDGWLAAHDAEVTARVSGSPPATQVRLYVVLGYRECETDDVPIPGEPCRSEDDMMKSSRIADDFLLELRLDPPDQSEEWAVRDLVHWLRQHMQIVSSGTSVDLGVFLGALRSAALFTSPPASWPPFSPSASPPDFLLDSSPPGPMPVLAADAPAYLRAALGVWVTELRPSWRPSWMGDAAPCTGVQPGNVRDGDVLLLAAIDVNVTHEVGGGGPWKVSTAAGALSIDETPRPLLFHLRLLQELLLAGSGNAPGSGPSTSPTAPPATIVAAGRLPGLVGPARGAGGLRVLAAANGMLTLGFDGLAPPPPGAPYDYLVKASVEPSMPAFQAPWATFGGYTVLAGVPAFQLLVFDLNTPVVAGRLAVTRFGIEVTRFQIP